MENDEFMKESLKFSYGILSLIIELVTTVDDESYLNLLLPITYYLSEFKN